MSRFLPALALGLLMPLAASHAADSEDDKLAAFFAAHLKAEFAERPLEATRLGDRSYDHLLDDLSAEARAGWKKRYQKTLADLPKAVDYKKLSRPGQIDFEILTSHL